MYRIFLVLLQLSFLSPTFAQDLPEDLSNETLATEEDEDFLQPVDLREAEEFDDSDFVEGEYEDPEIERPGEPQIADEEVGPPKGDDLDSDFFEDDNEFKASSDEDLGELPSSLVVEQEYIAVRRTEHVEDAIPLYKDRRDRWGLMFSLSYGTYSPDSYVPVDGGTTFDALYGTSGSVQATILKKLNFDLGALVFGGGAGIFSASSSSGASLTVIPIRAEAGFILDTLFGEPLFAPYFAGGVIVNQYDETGASETQSGTTGIAPYFVGGVNFQLDWLDRESALNTYLDYGLENTFVFLEARSYVASVGDDPDFSSSIHFAGGVRFEF